MTQRQPPPDAIGCTEDTVASALGAEERLQYVAAGSEHSHRVADFIGARFEQAFKARPTIRAPAYITLSNKDQALIAAVGLRPASQQRLFLEQYLSAPIETFCFCDTDRQGVIELAHLAGVTPWVAHRFFPMLGYWLSAQRYQWVCFTATLPVRLHLRQLGINWHTLGAASPDHLNDAGASWGQYYRYRPQVLLAHVSSGMLALSARQSSAVESRPRTARGGHHVVCA